MVNSLRDSSSFREISIVYIFMLVIFYFFFSTVVNISLRYILLLNIILCARYEVYLYVYMCIYLYIYIRTRTREVFELLMQNYVKRKMSYFDYLHVEIHFQFTRVYILYYIYKL